MKPQHSCDCLRLLSLCCKLSAGPADLILFEVFCFVVVVAAVVVHLLCSVDVPVLQVKSEDCEKSCRILIHALQLVPQTQYKVCEFEKFVNISDRGDTTQAFPVMVSECVLWAGVCVCVCGVGVSVTMVRPGLPD